ncbi:MAG: hypothetical protein EOM19_02165 [Candidatus Moranbacteria bacterium]|nr:hypothetical protein [Candidatus Moranbacteria bacterium]
MKIAKSQLKKVLTILKPMETKDQTIVLETKNNILNIMAKREGIILKLKAIKTDEQEAEPMAIKKDFLNKIEKQDAEEFELKINKKTISSKVNGVSFTTSLLSEEAIFEIKEEKVEATQFTITSEIMKALDDATSFVSKDGKKGVLQGILIRLNENEISVIATDSIKMYVNRLTTDCNGKEDIIIRPEVIAVLKSIFEVNNEKPFPVLANKNAILVSSKGMFMKANLFEGTFPDIERVLENGKSKSLEYKGTLSDDVIKKLKAIEGKTQILSLEKTEKEMTFETKSEIETNSFKVKDESEFAFEKKVNYHSFLNVISIAPNFEVRENLIIFEKEKVKILLMAMLKD